MYTLISLFYISLIGIIAMLLLKRREVKTGFPSLISRLGKGTDDFFRSVWYTGRRFAGYFNRRTFILLIQLIAYHILLPIRRVYVEIKHRVLSNPHGKKVLDAVRGKGEVKNHGASFYLRRISDR